MTGREPDPHPDSPPPEPGDAGEPARREDPGIDDVDPRPAPEPDGTAGGSGGEVRNQGDDAQ